ncbi:MAG: FkbM family methyltransferase [Kiritimatiellae bacterium]|nr:FkbM family methyltransferase [Kiritimatiellia bacterium]
MDDATHFAQYLHFTPSMFNNSFIAERLKLRIRIAEARWNPRVRHSQFRDTPLKLVNSTWWNTTDPTLIEQEIGAYFDALPSPLPPDSHVLDAGAAAGLFSISWALKYPNSKLFAFEPSERQRTLLTRNATLNKVSRKIAIFPTGLWNEPTTLSFRTHGDISSVEGLTPNLNRFQFTEHIPVIKLDDWVQQNKIEKLDLIKMDIEGAEIEALHGATQTLQSLKPQLLVQAYHIRNGVRTLEPCVDWLTRQCGYACREWRKTALIHATPPR